MLIDWFTVAAQIVNFLVLVWLLKRFLYRRILGAIEARENRIAARLAAADAKDQEARQQLALYQDKLQDFDQRREEMLAQARSKAESLETQMLEQAREHLQALEAKWQEELNRERETFLLELRRRAASGILVITRRALADLACMDVQESVIRAFVEKIRSVGDEDLENLSQCDLVVRAACDLSEETQSEIRQAIEDRLRRPTALRFERAPATGLGLEIRGNGWRLGWNSESYMEALEQDLRAAFEHSPELKAHSEVI